MMMAVTDRSRTAELSPLAEAFAATLPADGVRVASAAPPEVVGAALASAITASFVGESTLEFAIVVADAEAITGGADTSGIPLDALLRPALEAASAVRGHGVLSDARTADASALLERGVAFSLTTKKAALGWLIIAETITAASPEPADRQAALGRLNNVLMTLTVEIGRTTMPVRSVLALEPGSVVELDRSAGAPADVLLNGRRIALGEIVVVDQDYAVRITQILDAVETAD